MQFCRTWPVGRGPLLKANPQDFGTLSALPAISCQLTVFFDDPFWVAHIELVQDGSYCLARHVFGPEPTMPELQAFACSPWERLRFTPGVAADAPAKTHANPKRMLRQVRKDMVAQAGRGTLSQQALSLQREQSQQQRATRAADRKRQDRDHQYSLRTAKRKQKRKGH